MNLQQGWVYTAPLPPGCKGDSTLHCGIDYIEGTIDNSPTWQHFPVVAAADGEACGNCVDGPGNKVYIKHTVNGKAWYTYYGHLDWIAPWIPIGSRTNTVHVTRGSQIGTAGDRGTNSGWVHLHFGFTDGTACGKAFCWSDPYDLRAKRDSILIQMAQMVYNRAPTTIGLTTPLFMSLT